MEKDLLATTGFLMATTIIPGSIPFRQTQRGTLEPGAGMQNCPN
jgi:hypothetical protein